MEIIALIVAVGSLVVAVFAARYGKQNADAADKAALIAERSADAAKDSAEAARVVAEAERARDHEMYRPVLPQPPVLQVERSETTGRYGLFFVFTPARSYRVQGDKTLRQSGGVSRLDVGPVVRAGWPVKVFIENLGAAQDYPLAEYLTLRFWPPVAGDGVEELVCPCGRPADDEAVPHWDEWRVPVEIPETGWRPPSVRMLDGSAG